MIFLQRNAAQSVTRLLTSAVLCSVLSSICPAQSPLDLLESQRDVEQLDPNSHLPNPDASSKAEAEETDGAKRVLTVNPTWAGSSLDALWAHAVFFEDAQNPYIQSVAIAGMLHNQGAWGQIRTDNEIENLNQTRTRRLRLGARMKAFHKIDIEAIGDLEAEGQGHDLHSLKAEISLTGRDRLQVGKFRPGFSYEGNRSSQSLPTVERSLLGNLLIPERSLGALFTHEFNTYSASLGYFDGSTSNGFGKVRGKGYLYAGLEGLLALDEEETLRHRWHIDYIYNTDSEESESITRSRFGGQSSIGSGIPLANPMFRHLFSAGVEVEEGRWNFVADALFARGDAGSVWGVTIQPSYWLIPGTLQLVGRLHYAKSADPNVLIQGFGAGADPVEGIGPYASGDEFYSIYAGANLHLYQDKLKILTGVEYSRLSDGDTGDTAEATLLQTGARLSF